MDDSVERIDLFSDVATSRDSNEDTYVAGSWVPYHINTITLGDNDHSACAELRFSTPRKMT